MPGRNTFLQGQNTPLSGGLNTLLPCALSNCAFPGAQNTLLPGQNPFLPGRNALLCGGPNTLLSGGRNTLLSGGSNASRA